MNVTVIGAGLAGSECAWQLAQRGIQVELHEMKPEKMTPPTQRNTLRSCAAPTPSGARVWKTPWAFLKEELRRLDSLILNAPMPPGWRPAAHWQWTATALPGW